MELFKNGVLKVKTIKENYSGSTYTSARILSKDKFSFKCGRVEIRAKLPSGGGTIDPDFTSSTFEIDYVRVYN